MRVENAIENDKIRILLVRHGETDYNLEKKVQGQGEDVELNENGKKQAKLLGSRLKNEKIDFIASSTLKRAIQTSQLILSQFNPEERGRKIHQYDGLREMNFGPQFEGKFFDKKMAKIPGNIHNQLASVVRKWVVEGELDHCLPGGESPVQVESRSRQAFFQILHSMDQNNQPVSSPSLNHPKTILIVCHGRLLKILLCSLLDIGLENMEKFGQNNTAVNVLEYSRSSNSFSLCLLNCTSHLEIPPNN